MSYTTRWQCGCEHTVTVYSPTLWQSLRMIAVMRRDNCPTCGTKWTKQREQETKETA